MIDPDFIIQVTVWDSETWQFMSDDIHRFREWAEGDWSCDCHREYLFKGDDYFLTASTCLGHKRYLVVYCPELDDVDVMNKHYPEELRNKALYINRELMEAHSLFQEGWK